MANSKKEEPSEAERLANLSDAELINEAYAWDRDDLIRRRRIEFALLHIQETTGLYLGICVNHAMHPDTPHPHWDHDFPRGMDFTKPVIH